MKNGLEGTLVLDTQGCDILVVRGPLGVADYLLNNIQIEEAFLIKK